MNVDEEVQKLDKALEKIAKSRDSLAAQMALPDYETKIPEKVRQANDQKVRRAPLPAANAHDRLTRSYPWRGGASEARHPVRAAPDDGAVRGSRGH